MSTFQVDKELLAWAAGFFDGEGCVGISLNSNTKGHTSPRLRVGIAQIDPDVLEKFLAAVTVGRIKGPYGPYAKNPDRKPYWNYSTEAFQNVQFVMCCLWPWLSTVKKNDYKRAVAIYLEWVQAKECRKKHPYSYDKNGKIYCPTCFTERNLARWEAQRQHA